MGSIAESVYEKMPVFLQNIILSLYGGYIHLERYNSKYKKLIKELDKSQYYTLSEHINYQNDRLKDILNHAYQNVPYYRDKFDSIKLKPGDIKNINDLHKVPILTRNDIKNNFKKLTANNFKKNELKLGHTSGTTGSPLEFFWDKNIIVMTNAIHWRQRNWAGLNLGDRFAVILGRAIVPIKQTKPPFWRFNIFHNQLFLSSFHLTSQNISNYFEKLYEFKPNVLEGYPSTVYLLANYLISKKTTFPLKSVLTSSETLHSEQRAVIEKAFSCKVYDYYGMAERTVFAFECSKHEGHHLNMEYGITEIISKDGQPANAGELGRIVATGIHNYGMPLIRYETSDVSAIKEESCSCGREMPLLEDVMTKAEDIVTTKDGRYISPSILTHPFKPLNSIIKSQIIQENLDHITIKIVKRNEYNENDTAYLLGEFEKRLGKDVKIKIDFVNDIERTSRGKFRWVISKVPLEF